MGCGFTTRKTESRKRRRLLVRYVPCRWLISKEAEAVSCNESLENLWIRGESKNDEFAKYHAGAWKRTNEMHARINMFHLAVSRLFKWTIKCTFCWPYFGHGENSILRNLEKTNLVQGRTNDWWRRRRRCCNEPLGHICIRGESGNDEFGEYHVGGAWSW